MIYPSKRDRWLEVVSLIACVGVAASVVAAAPEIEPASVRFASLGLSVLVVAFVLSVLYSTMYFFEAGQLCIRSGPFRWRIPLADIESVEPSRNPLSSPACSLDRLKIRYGRRWILISPLDKAGFVEALAEHCPRLERIGC